MSLLLITMALGEFCLVRFRGRTGNNLFQYAIGRILADKFSLPLVCPAVPNYPAAHAFGEMKDRLAAKALLLPKIHRWTSVRFLSGHALDFESVRSDRRLVVDGFFQRYEHYAPHKEKIRAWFEAEKTPSQNLTDVLTVSIRSGDIWRRNLPLGHVIHRAYPSLPFSYYMDLIRLHPRRRVILITDEPQAPLVRRIAKETGAQIAAGGPLEHLKLIKQSSAIVMALSTFSWWMSFLSAAEVIYYPKLGVFDPDFYRRVGQANFPDLQVTDESRYVTVPCASEDNWQGSEEDEARILES